jgi:hypothetical protein
MTPTDSTEPTIVIVWDPELISEEDYADVIEAVGNVVRSHGGLGIKLLRSNTYGAMVDEGVVL